MRVEETMKATVGGTEDVGAECVASIQAAMAAANLNASGKTSASLGYQQGTWRLTVFADGEHAPFATLQNSVKPTPQGGDGFLPQILQWVKDKGLSVTQGPRQTLESAQRAAAGAIYHSIWERGTRQTFPPRKDIYTPALDEAVDRFAEQVGDAVVKFILKK